MLTKFCKTAGFVLGAATLLLSALFGSFILFAITLDYLGAENDSVIFLSSFGSLFLIFVLVPALVTLGESDAPS